MFLDKVEEVTEAHIVTTTTVTKPSKENNVLVTDVLKTETSVTKSHTKQIKPNDESSKDINEETENLLLPLVTIDLLHQKKLLIAKEFILQNPRKCKGYNFPGS